MKQFPKNISTQKFLQKKQAELEKQSEDELCHHRKQIAKLLTNGHNNESDDDNKSDEDNDDDNNKSDIDVNEHTSITYSVSEEYDYKIREIDNYYDKMNYICSTIVSELTERGFNAAYKKKSSACTNCYKIYYEIYIWTTYAPSEYYEDEY